MIIQQSFTMIYFKNCHDLDLWSSIFLVLYDFSGRKVDGVAWWQCWWLAGGRERCEEEEGEKNHFFLNKNHDSRAQIWCLTHDVPCQQ